MPFTLYTGSTCIQYRICTYFGGFGAQGREFRGYLLSGGFGAQGRQFRGYLLLGVLELKEGCCQGLLAWGDLIGAKGRGMYFREALERKECGMYFWEQRSFRGNLTSGIYGALPYTRSKLPRH